MFLLYINDLPLCGEHRKLFMFTNDTIVVFKNNEHEDLEIKAYTELSSILLIMLTFLQGNLILPFDN